MTTPMNDDEMLEVVAELMTADGPPPSALELAYAAYGWRTLDTDLAHLTEDVELEVVGFHRGAYARLLTYDSAHGAIEVGVADDEVELIAHPTPRRVLVERPDRPGAVGLAVEVALDELGRVRRSGLSGPIRFRVEWVGGTTTTPWLTM